MMSSTRNSSGKKHVNWPCIFPRVHASSQRLRATLDARQPLPLWQHGLTNWVACGCLGGDASMEPLAAQSKLESAPPSKKLKYCSRDPAKGHARGREELHVLGKLRTKPGRVDAMSTESMSCRYVSNTNKPNRKKERWY